MNTIYHIIKRSDTWGMIVSLIISMFCSSKTTALKSTRGLAPFCNGMDGESVSHFQSYYLLHKRMPGVYFLLQQYVIFNRIFKTRVPRFALWNSSCTTRKSKRFQRLDLDTIPFVAGPLYHCSITCELLFLIQIEFCSSQSLIYY